MGLYEDFKKLNKILSNLEDRLEAFDKRINKQEDCCLELHREFSRVASEIAIIPTVVDKMILSHKLSLLEGKD